MTATIAATEEPTRREVGRPTKALSRNALAGTGVLIRFILRRDRIKLPIWLAGTTLVLFYLATVAATLIETEEQLEDVARFMQGGMGAVFGPGYGRDSISTDVYVAGVYGLVLFVLAALMSMLLVTRHTRAEEQDGRAELVRSAVVGRHAPLTAVLAVAIGTNVVLALAAAGVMTAKGYDVGGGLLFGASIGAVGLVFSAITAITVQVTEYSRAATGMVGAALGAAWVVRAAGDMMSDYGSPLSWMSPLAWSNQTRPYVDGRWWPLLLSVGLASAAAAIGYVLAGRRDVGAGLMAVRAGAPHAAPWLRSPLAAAFRLQRASLAWWTVGLATAGFIFCGLADQVTDLDGMSEDRIEMFGGSVDTLVEGYLGVMTGFAAALVAVMAVLGINAARAEETRGRAEPILATATSRTAWLGSYLAVAAAGVVGVLAVVGLFSGVGAAISVADGSYVGRMTIAHVAHAPGVLVLAGIAAVAFGVLPRAMGATWVMLGYGVFNAMFGPALDVPQWVANLLPMAHSGQPPLDPLAWPAMTILVGLAAALTAIAVIAFRRRDLDTK